ncbi:jg27750, partial [Pararge aegeria aegeria]
MQGQVICKHNTLLDYESKMQLDTVLQHLKLSLPVKQPNVEVYPDSICLQNSESTTIMQTKQILDELLVKLKIDYKKSMNVEQIDSVSESGSPCIYKQLKMDSIKTTSTPLFETLSNNFTETTQLNDKHKDCIGKQLAVSHIEGNKNQSIMKEVVIKQKTIRTETKKTKEIEKQDEETKHKKIYMAGNDDDEDMKRQQLYTTKENANKKQKSYSTRLTNTNNIKKNKNAEIKKQDSFYQLMRKLIKENNVDKIQKGEKYTKVKKNEKVPVTGDLPIIKTTIKAKVKREDSGSTVECNGTSDHPVPEIIIGNNILQYDSRDKENSEMKTPLFKISADSTTPILEIYESVVKDKSITKEPEQVDMGVIFYKLSDRKFIENGWTQLPKTKIMRR